MARWYRILQPDWHCEAKVAPFCGRLATWEEERTGEQIKRRELAPLRCDEHLPTDAVKVDPDEDEVTEPQRKEIA